MKKKNGYTILELMVTIGIIAILTAMAIPSFINWLPGYRLRSAANDVHSAMQLARLRAVKENGDVGVSYINGSGKNGQIRVFVDSNNSGTYDTNDSVIQYGEMPGAVSLLAPMAQSIFDGRGLATAGIGTVQLISTSAGTKSIQLVTTGNVRIL